MNKSLQWRCGRLKQKNTPIYSFLNNKTGGILLPVLVIFLMMSFLLIMVTEDYFSRRELLGNTKDYYLARALEELSIMEMEVSDTTTVQTFYFEEGKVDIQRNKNDQRFQIETSLNNQYKRTSLRTIDEKKVR